MCLIGFSFGLEQSTPLVLAANRDEYYERATDAAHWWSDSPDIFAGRDRVAGGSWLAINRAGRLAALTNFREGNGAAMQRSRGELVSNALDMAVPLTRFFEQVHTELDAFAGFSLLVFEWGGANGRVTRLQAYCLSNRTDESLQSISPGIHGLSNGPLNAPWPKSLRLTGVLRNSEHQDPAQRHQQLLQALTDGTMDLNPGQALPHTGVGPQLEKELAPAYIHTGERGYGTRSTAIISLEKSGMMQADEWTWTGQSRAISQSRRTSRFATGM